MATLLPLNTAFNEQFLCDVAIDWSNPLTRGLIVSLYNSVRDSERPPINYVNGVVGTGAVITKSAPAIAKAEPGGWLSTGSISGSGVGNGPINKINGAASFNGSTSWAQLPLDLAKQHQITVAYWYNRTSAVDSVSLEYGANWTGNGWIMDPQSGGAMLLGVDTAGLKRFLDALSANH
jgi:hypothetical protein